MKQQIQRLSLPQGADLDYLLYLPPDYEAQDTWPLILYLHGAGERGDDPTRVLLQPLPKLLETDDLPFVVVSPQCPLGMWWTSYLDPVRQLLKETIQNYKIDTSRVYLTGISMGGYGSWQLAMEDPDLFAAVVPICGGWPFVSHIDKRICALKDKPVWVFHGAKDDVVSAEESVALVDALRACGGSPRLTIYPDLKHDSWTETYLNKGLYEWMLAHRSG